ncbi:MAG: DNA mismatch repair protein MutS [Candidatus Hydrogenedentes bacterium]|nr:DNA mismatch repair protein MutS [Candidatus Hydrogenedentota bacterium]
MSQTVEPKAEYQRRLAARQETVRRLDKQDALYANLRLVVFLAALAIIAAAIWGDDRLWVWLAVPVLAFVVLVVRHDRVIRARDRARIAIAFYEHGIARIEDRWAGMGLSGEGLAPTDHLCASDLDLVGRGSLFELMCLARTRAGQQALADWLCAPAEVDEILARQKAVDELRSRLDLREDLAQFGQGVREGVHPEVLVAWATAPQAFCVARARAIATLVGAALVVSFVMLLLGVATFPFIAAIAVAWAVTRPLSKGVRNAIAAIDEPKRELAVLAMVLARLEREPVASARLKALMARITSQGQSASACIARLHRLATWHEARNNQLFTPVAALLLWDVQFACAFETWRTRHGNHVSDWLNAVGELEALCSMSAYAYEHPRDPFPEIVEEGPFFHGDELGHPLLPSATRVCNGVRLDATTRMWVVSGSNMSGKSTLLRTVGINAVLAQMGAPVCAKSLRISPLTIGATLRIQDSIHEGRSRFYAEIKRLRAVMDLTKEAKPVLFLFDEILAGTNSHDRQLGAEAILKGFLDAGAIGLVTTHDLALARIADALTSRAANVHFEDHLEDGKLVFDYRLRSGVVQKSNALELMRAVGLDV